MRVRISDFLLFLVSIKNPLALSHLVSRQDPNLDLDPDTLAPQENAQDGDTDADLAIVASNDLPQTSTLTENGNNSENNDENENAKTNLVPPAKYALDPEGNVLPFPISPELFENLQRGIDNLISPPVSIPQSPKKENPPSTHPDELPQGIQNPEPTRNDGCDPNSPKSCAEATAQIIYPRACSAVEENESVTLTLNKMVGGTSKVYISEDRRCGVFFWATKLKPPQIRKLKKMRAVRAIAPDGKIESYSTRANPNPETGESTDSSYKSRLKKRITVQSETTSSERDLAYISTPYGAKLGETYTHFPEAGLGTTAYVLGEGLNPSNFEFTRIPDRGTRFSAIKDWLYGLGVDATQSNQVPGDDETACGASKVAGLTDGVAPEADLIIVKILVQISSYLDGVQKVINHLEDRLRIHPEVLGRNVFLIQYGWEVLGQLDINQRALQDKIKILMDDKHQVVVVAAAGFAKRGIHYVNSVPALFSLNSETPVIAVGSISQFVGNRPEESPIGDAVSIVAPYNVICAGSEQGNFMVHMRGTGVSAAIVAGMVLYFMSLEAEGVGDWITGSLNVPKTAKAYLRLKAYKRKKGQDLAAWNGLSPVPGDDGNHGWNAFAPGAPDE